MPEQQRHDLAVKISALKWDRVEDLLFVIGIVMAPTGLGLGFWSVKGDVPMAFPVGLTVACLGGLSFYIGSSGALRYFADKRERKAGYTTIPLPHDPEVDLVEPKTGIVIREAGAPALTMEEYTLAVRRMLNG